MEKIDPKELELLAEVRRFYKKVAEKYNGTVVAIDLCDALNLVVCSFDVSKDETGLLFCPWPLYLPVECRTCGKVTNMQFLGLTTERLRDEGSMPIYACECGDECCVDTGKIDFVNWDGEPVKDDCIIDDFEAKGVGPHHAW